MRLHASLLVISALSLTAAAEQIGAQATSSSLEITVQSADDNRPLAGAQVFVEGLGMRAVTDKSGFARVADLPTGELAVQVRYLGHTSLNEALLFQPGEATRVVVKLTPTPLALEEVEVDGSTSLLLFRGFYDRQRSGQGTFFTREDIARISPPRMSDVLRRVGIAAGSNSQGRFPTGDIRGPSTISTRCSIQYYVDGAQTVDYNIDYVHPADVEGLEIYKGASTVPPEFNKGSAMCGVILIWTRVD